MDFFLSFFFSFFFFLNYTDNTHAHTHLSIYVSRCLTSPSVSQTSLRVGLSRQRILRLWSRFHTSYFLYASFLYCLPHSLRPCSSWPSSFLFTTRLVLQITFLNLLIVALCFLTWLVALHLRGVSSSFLVLFLLYRIIIK